MTRYKIRTLMRWLWIGAAGILPLLLPAQALSASASQLGLLPIFGPDSRDFIGLSLINTSTVKNEVVVTWTDPQGVTSRTASLTLAPGAQRVALLREILAIPEDPTLGWIRIDSSAPGLLSYMTSGRDDILDGTESASAVSTRITLSHVAVNTGFTELAFADTLVSLVNPGTGSVDAHVELIDLNGVAAGDLSVSITARACRTLRVSESFRDALPPNSMGGRTFAGYMKISSDPGLAAWLRVDTPLSRRLLRGRGEEETAPARLAIASHFAFGSSALYHSELSLINAGNSAVTLDLVAQDDRGGKLGSASRTLNPGQGFRENVLDLFAIATPAIYPPVMVTGYVRIRAANGGEFQAIGDVDIARDGNVAAMLTPIATSFSSDLTIPFAISGSNYFTGYAIANENEMLTVQTDVTIELFDPDGSVVGTPRKVSLSPSARFVGMVEDKIPAGYLRVRANGPVALLGSLGTSDVSILAPLPGVPSN